MVVLNTIAVSLLVGVMLLKSGKGQQQTVLFSEVSNQPMLRFQLLNTHNSYHRRPTPYVPEAFINYTSLTQQLSSGVRGLDFDIHRTSDAAVFNVYHAKDYDQESTVSTLTEALDEIEAFMSSSSGTIYNGEPVVVGLEPRNETFWSATDFSNLDAVIRAAVGASNIFKPTDLGADPQNTSKHFPDWTGVKMSDLQSKLLFRSPARELPDYFDNGDLNAAELAFFYSCKTKEEDSYYCAMFNINDALAKYSDVKEFSRKYPIKCNADSRYLEIPNVTFAYNTADSEWKATHDGITEAALAWAAGLMFSVIDVNSDDVVTYAEAYEYTYQESETDEDALEYVEEEVQPLTPIARVNYTDLIGLYDELFGDLSVNRSYTAAQSEAALSSGCQVIQTEHISQATHYLGDYVFDLGCGGVSHVEFRYTDEKNNSFCVVFDDDDDDDDAAQVLKPLNLVVAVLVSLVALW